MTSFAEYRRLPGVNASSLKAMAVSPLHYEYGLANDRPDSPAMARGRAIHTACLEPDEFPRRYVLWNGPRTTKAWHEFKATVPSGVEVLSDSDYDDCLAARDAVRTHPVAARYLAAGHAEQTVTWVDHDTDLPLKARLDWIADGPFRSVVDLKSAGKIDEVHFEYQTEDLLYYVSAAHYVAGMQAITEDEWPFHFIAVESKPPHDVRCGPLSEDALWAGEQERTRLLRLVADCTASGEWPGAYPDETEFDMPPRFYAQGERDSEAEIKILEGLAPRDGARP